MRRFLLLLALLTPIPSHAADAALLISIIECESSGRYDAVGDDGISQGIAQFRKETFYELAKEAGFKNFRWHNPIHQMKVLNWALDNGYSNRWTCFRKLQEELGEIDFDTRAKSVGDTESLG